MFIAGAAFDNADMLATAKLGVIAASVISAGLGWLLMTLNSPVPDSSTQIDLIQISESPDFG